MNNDKKTFRVDLGQGDSVDVIIEQSKEYSLKDFMNDVKNSNGWIETVDTAIQVKHIKRIVEMG